MKPVQPHIPDLGVRIAHPPNTMLSTTAFKKYASLFQQENALSMQSQICRKLWSSVSKSSVGIVLMFTLTLSSFGKAIKYVDSQILKSDRKLTSQVDYVGQFFKNDPDRKEAYETLATTLKHIKTDLDAEFGKAISHDSQTLKQVLYTIGRSLQKQGYTYEQTSSIGDGILKKKLDCDTFTMIYVMVADSYQLPFFYERGLVKRPTGKLEGHAWIAVNATDGSFTWESTAMSYSDLFVEGALYKQIMKAYSHSESYHNRKIAITALGNESMMIKNKVGVEAYMKRTPGADKKSLLKEVDDFENDLRKRIRGSIIEKVIACKTRSFYTEKLLLLNAKQALVWYTLTLELAGVHQDLLLRCYSKGGGEFTETLIEIERIFADYTKLNIPDEGLNQLTRFVALLYKVFEYRREEKEILVEFSVFVKRVEKTSFPLMTGKLKKNFQCLMLEASYWYKLEIK